MSNLAFFRINQPAVISEVVDGEAIVVNLESGTYYSMRDSAEMIWTALSTGADATRISATLARAYDTPAEQIQASVGRFLTDLATERLIVPADDPAAELPVTTAPPPGRTSFTAPVLEKYTDMAELLLLDPIHDVAAHIGWPQHPSGQA